MRFELILHVVDQFLHAPNALSWCISCHCVRHFPTTQYGGLHRTSVLCPINIANTCITNFALASLWQNWYSWMDLHHQLSGYEPGILLIELQEHEIGVVLKPLYNHVKHFATMDQIVNIFRIVCPAGCLSSLTNIAGYRCYIYKVYLSCCMYPKSWLQK